MDTKEIISSGILEQYVLGATAASENAQVVAWAAEFPEVAEEIRSIQNALESFAIANAIEPKASTKAEIFAKINDQASSIQAPVISLAESKTSVFTISNKWKLVAAVSIGILVISAALNLFYFNKYSTINENLAVTKQALANEQARAKEFKNDWDIVRNPNNTLVSLKGVETNPDATAKIFWFQQTGEVLIDASNLPNTPSGMQYQFWAIVDGKPVDGGLIITNDAGKKYRIQKMRSFGKAQAFAISIEKAGGSPSPTTVVSLGKII